MWNLKASSKIIQQSHQRRSYEIHQQKLKHIQSQIKIQEPYQPDFIYTKNKLNMSRKDRRKEIDRLNGILLMKMDAIKDQEYTGNRLREDGRRNLGSLNSKVVEERNQRIATENQRFCHKLMKAKSFYPTNTIIEKANHLDYIGTNISLNARRSSSVQNLLTAHSGPKSSYTTQLSSHFCSIKKRIKQNQANVDYDDRYYKSGNKEQRLYKSERPQTAPMFIRSHKIVVHHNSVNPRIVARTENNGEDKFGSREV